MVKNLLILLKKSATDAFKIASKRAIQKTAKIRLQIRLQVIQKNR